MSRTLADALSSLEGKISLSEMAFDRSTWIDKVRDNHLSGALGEYAKLQYALAIGESDSWSNEVKKLLTKISYFMKTVKTKSKFNRDTAFKEAYREASLAQSQVTDAKNEILKYYPEKRSELFKHSFDSEDLLKKMVKEYLPSEYKLIKGE